MIMLWRDKVLITFGKLYENVSNVVCVPNSLVRNEQLLKSAK